MLASAVFVTLAISGERRPLVANDCGHSEQGTLSETLGAIARTLQAEPDVDATLAAIVKAAVDHVEGAEFAGISLLERGRAIRTVAPTEEVVTEIDAVQYRTQQGPCVDAIADHHVYRTGDLAAEDRWPDFAPVAAEFGARSMLSYRLFVTDTTLGALNLYSREQEAFSGQTEDDGRMFATHAAIALVGAQTEADLRAALEHRDVIGMAKGILMQRHDLDDEIRAFRVLVEASQNSNMKLHRVAAWLIEHRRDL
ncbi:GAF and ANTAR domain-containing protein [Amycolatopsis rubida]|uniref:GAF and ANTAR domain-containing protein n=2 Tax=Pseudonocardiaceae TaxID=2070 RepID=A0ABX0BZB3_9PSEU|nr:GAF and ANTAR domain-containing protein [Amycolatopsis rubida]MYW94174.1 ANTAR domain-containing protein [Amycolatopsis rubida]NEC59163.1 GAF and ANTAR domain-containing protein [Amycolatopsis rubida]